jgi:hypothetical protein
MQHRCDCGHVAENHYQISVDFETAGTPIYPLPDGSPARCCSWGCSCPRVRYAVEFTPAVVWRDPMVAHWRAAASRPPRRRPVQTAALPEPADPPW